MLAEGEWRGTELSALDVGDDGLVEGGEFGGGLAKAEDVDAGSVSGWAVG